MINQQNRNQNLLGQLIINFLDLLLDPQNNQSLRSLKRKEHNLLVELVEILMEIIQCSSFISVGFLGIQSGEDFIYFLKQIVLTIQSRSPFLNL